MSREQVDALVATWPLIAVLVVFGIALSTVDWWATPRGDQ